jgi:hypothetical protein
MRHSASRITTSMHTDRREVAVGIQGVSAAGDEHVSLLRPQSMEEAAPFPCGMMKATLSS